MVGAQSPEWVAHTGYKGKHCEMPVKCEEEVSREGIEVWKRSLSETINLLRHEGTHLASNPLYTSNLQGLDALVEQLVESYS
jgi:hypothetical protein